MRSLSTEQVMDAMLLVRKEKPVKLAPFAGKPRRKTMIETLIVMATPRKEFLWFPW